MLQVCIKKYIETLRMKYYLPILTTPIGHRYKRLNFPIPAKL